VEDKPADPWISYPQEKAQDSDCERESEGGERVGKMLENSTPAVAPPDSTAAVSSSSVKRYAPPNQRNRLNRRKSGDRSDRNNTLYANDGDKSQQLAPSRNIPVMDHADPGSGSIKNENFRPRLIALEGCSRSEASQLLNDRWAAIMHRYNDTSIDLSERPVMYPGSSASAWGQFRLPHQLMASANNSGPSSGPQIDFLSDLHRAMHNTNASYGN